MTDGLHLSAILGEAVATLNEGEALFDDMDVEATLSDLLDYQEDGR